MDKLLNFFKLLSDKNRFRIVALLSKKKLCVCELACVLGVSQPSVSRHIKKIKETGLIHEEQDGFWTNYFLKCSDVKIQQLLKYFQEYIDKDKIILDDFKKLKKIDRTKICRR